MKIYSIPPVLCFIISISSVSSQSEGSCAGRCGQGYVRADPCHCDYTCMSYLECCHDYKKVCTTEASCKGRCHEGFIRGQTCDCDPGCGKFGKCCSDYEDNCGQKNAQPTYSSQDQPNPDERGKPPESTKKPDDKVPEDIPEDRIQKDEAVPEKAKKVPLDQKDPSEAIPKVAQPTKKTTKRSPKRLKYKKNDLSAEVETQDPSQNSPTSPLSSPKKNRKRIPRRPAKKRYRKVIHLEDDDEDPYEGNAPTRRHKKIPPKEDKKNTEYSTSKNPRKKKRRIVVEYEDDLEDPNYKWSSPKNKKRLSKNSPKIAKKKKAVVETEEEIEEPFSNDKDRKPKKPKKTGDDNEDPDGRPKDDIDENTSQSNQRAAKKRSPTKKKLRKPEDDTDDPSKNPSPSGKRKKKPNSNEPKKKKGRRTEYDIDEPSKPGKRKNPKNKHTSRTISKTKKKINSEEERQETIEREFSSSSQSSTSHSRSKSSTRRLKGKKNPKDKKKPFPEKPEDPLMPPKQKKESPSTPVPTFIYDGSGDDGSGMDFVSTTTLTTTLMVHSTTTALQTTMKTNQTTGTMNPSKPTTKNPAVTSDKGGLSTPTILPTKKGPEKTTNVMNASTQSPTVKDKTTGKSMSTDSPLQQTSTLQTPQDQSTTDSSGIAHTTVSGTLQETTNTFSYKSEPVDLTKQTLPITDNATTQKSQQAQTKETTTHSAITKITESTTSQSDHTMSSKITTKAPSAESHQTLTTEKPKDKSEVSTIMSTRKQRPTPTKIVRFQKTTKHADKDDTEMSTKSIRPTKTPRGFSTNKPMKLEEMENTKTTKPSTTNLHPFCNSIKYEAIKSRIPGDILKRIIAMCIEMYQHYPLVSTPSPDRKQPITDYRKIPSGYPHLITSNWNPEPGIRINQIVEEIYRRMNSSPMTNLTGIHGYTIHNPSIWSLLLNKIRSLNDPQKNLCIGQPADGMTTLQNGSMVTFRGQYFWTLNQGGVMGSPRKITEVWGIPSPIDTVFTRCNCGGKTFFFKGSRYWRFTNDVMDQGYPKEIINGFGGLSGKITAVLSVAGFRTRPESVYFFKPGGNVQRYTFRQEQAKKCIKKQRPSIQYPIYSQKIQTVKYRFPRDIVRHQIKIHRTYTSVQQPLGILHEQTSVTSTWRGVPNNIISAVSLPNYEKRDGFDYYVFSKDKYYNINMSSKVAMKPPPGSEQKTSKDWYKCKE